MPRKLSKTDQQFLEVCNTMLATSLTGSAEREGMIAVIEAFLHHKSAYRGFSYLTSDSVPVDCLPGIHGDGLDQPSFENTDPTRRKYAGVLR